MFIVLEDSAYITRAINTDHIRLVVLIDAGHHSPHRPAVNVLMDDGTLIENLWLPTVDQRTHGGAALAVHRFFYETLEGRQ